MKSTIRLFKAIPVTFKKEKKTSELILNKTIKRGFIFSPEVIYNHSDSQLLNLIKIIEKEVGLSSEQMNSSFHKSWQKIKEANIEQLVIEQIIHYITTYGFKRLGIYNKDSVYIPNEKLELPELDLKEIQLFIIKGYTKEELKEKLLKLLQSGIALSEDVKNDVADVATFINLNEEEIESIKNKEVKIMLYDYLNLCPKNPIEFLRYALYRSTGKTLLIKDKSTIEEIKSKKNIDVLGLFIKYQNKYGLERLAEIFYRYKPIFLAFRTNQKLKTTTNKIRKLAAVYHKPIKNDYLNTVTAKIKSGEVINKTLLEKELEKVNTFRKIRLAYALKFRTRNADSILYRIRNGKSYATTFSFQQKTKAKETLNIILDSIVKNLKKNVSGKKIYIPDYIKYALPATEKQFTGDFPSGTYISIPKDMIIGIHWENQDHISIDLDLSIISPITGKIGWNSSYRTEDRSILFSGDITDAPKPKGASELFYVKRQTMDEFILFANYYNFEKDIEVPFTIIVAQEQVSNFRTNYMVNPNNVVAIAKTKINQKQKILGLLVTTTNNCKFYFAESYMGRSITSSNSDFVENSRKYLFNYYKNTICLNELLEKAGGLLVKTKENCDIDLSPENLEKDKIIQLLY